jgi:signal transduction histidine kinase/CheY-like chemotaxis protein
LQATPSFLSTAPATRDESRRALFTVVAATLAFLALAPFARVQLEAHWAFVPMYQSALVVGDVITAALLLSHFYYLRSNALFVLASGYLFSACMAVAHMLTFPGLLSPTGLLDAGPQTTAWLYMFWHAGFPVAVIAYATLESGRWNLLPQSFAPGALIAFGAGTVAAATFALVMLASAGAQILPGIMQGNHYTPLMSAVVGSVWLTSLAALAVLWRKRSHTLLDLWLMVSTCAWIFDIALSAMLNAGRFDIGFYAGRVFGLIASTFVLIVLLIENGRLYARMVRAREREQAEHQDLIALNKDLEAAREVATAADRSKSAFLATISHEIRTPMNGVLGLLELLALGPLAPAQRLQVATIRESAQSLLRIIDDLLDISKIEAGRLDLSPEPASIAEVVASVSAAYAGVASAKNLILEEELDAGISPWVMVDHLRLRQILNNLVSNAIKFTDRGKVGLSARLETREGGHDLVRFTVRDTGIGVSKANQAKLFQPFVQAEPRTSRRFGGTGLGLSICQRLAGMMGSTIGMESAEGRGTTMTLVLRLPIASGTAMPPRPGDMVPGQAPNPAFRECPTVEEAERERTLVLVADDHPVNRMVLQRQLATIGYASECAENGREMLELWRTGRFALLLTDCHMPEIDGYEVALTVRSEEGARNLPPVPIIACTANAMKGEAERCIQVGMNDYLAKPVQIPELAGKLRMWLPWQAKGGLPGRAPEVENDLAAATSTAEPIDQATLDAVTGGSAAFAREVLQGFSDGYEARRAELHAALDYRDHRRVAEHAHRMAGACRTVGALRLARICTRIEIAAKDAAWKAIDEMRPELDREVALLRFHLLAVVNEAAR